MNKMKKSLMAIAILVGTCVAPAAALSSFGQELKGENGEEISQNAATSEKKSGGGC